MCHRDSNCSEMNECERCIEVLKGIVEKHPALDGQENVEKQKSVNLKGANVKRGKRRKDKCMKKKI